ncbi:hypothetical protein HZ326_16425 [Fusarium oxysporum f. sp. albedinis]|nr:hypothetical protein HZ326_16425 [Fusarium oxysporum f. sp. albedinis]
MVQPAPYTQICSDFQSETAANYNCALQPLGCTTLSKLNLQDFKFLAIGPAWWDCRSRAIHYLATTIVLITTFLCLMICNGL